MPETLWFQLKQVIFQRLKQAISQKENTESNARLRQQRESTDSNTRLRRYTFFTIAIGLSCILIFSASVTDGHNFLAKAGASLALGIGAAALGALLGFVFGIPRTLQHDIPPQASQDIGGREKIDYQINTSLEQISDWLTKIIIGVGLIELGNIGSWLMSFSQSTGSAFGELGEGYVLGVLVYFSGSSFLLGYLWTRLSFGLAIKEADKGLIERTIERFEAEARADGHALQLVARQLSATHSEVQVSQETLDTAVSKATRHTRVKIFYDAVTVRRDTERGENSIPVFRALISSDKGDRFYQNHGQLGFALKDKLRPNWKEAEEELTKAIEIRDRIGDVGFGLYEFNRAICRIHLEWQKEGIARDIATALKDKWAQKWTYPASCRLWLNENKTMLHGLGVGETQLPAGLLPN